MTKRYNLSVMNMIKVQIFATVDLFPFKYKLTCPKIELSVVMPRSVKKESYEGST